MKSQPVIILVDDDAGQIKSMNWLLGLDYDDVRTYQNAKEALEAIRELHKQNIPALLLTDYIMPEMDGIELVKALKNEDIRIPTIMRSATASMPEKVSAAGVSDRIDRLMDKSGEDVPKVIEEVWAQSQPKSKSSQIQPKSHTDHAKRPSDDDNLPPH